MPEGAVFHIDGGVWDDIYTSKTGCQTHGLHVDGGEWGA